MKFPKAVAPLNSTFLVPVNADSVMVTRVPGGRDVGVKLDTVGTTRNAVELVPVPDGEETVTGARMVTVTVRVYAQGTG